MMKDNEFNRIAECNKVRIRVSKYSPEQKAELLRQARAIIKKSRKK